MRKEEIASVQFGIELGMSAIGTVEMYADGGAENGAGFLKESKNADYTDRSTAGYQVGR